MINWRDGKAGFVGGIKRFIKGVFDPSYSVTTATVIPPELAMSTRNRIELQPERRNMELSFEDRNIDFPPLSRDNYL